MTIDPVEQRKFDSISKVVDRAIKAGIYGVEDRLSAIMDIESVEPDIDLEQLAGFDELNFVHDAAGIRNHLDRESFPARLVGGFWPRCGH